MLILKITDNDSPDDMPIVAPTLISNVVIWERRASDILENKPLHDCDIELRLTRQQRATIAAALLAEDYR